MVILRFLLLASLVSLPFLLHGCSGGNDGAGDGADVGAGNASVSDKLPASSANGTSDPAGASTSAFLAGGAAGAADDATADSSTAEPAKPAKPLEPRTSLEGRWELALHGFGGNILCAIVDITPSEGGFDVSVVGDSPLGWTLAESEIRDNAVELTFVAPNGRSVDFMGAFADGEVRGNVDSGVAGLDMATLRASARETLSQSDYQERNPDYDKLNSMQQDDNLLKNLIKLADEAGMSPMAFQLYNQSLVILQGQPTDEVDLSSFTEHYLAAASHWGERLANRTHLDIGFALALLGKSPEEALRHLDIAEKGLSENAPESLRDRLELGRALVLVDSDDQEQQEQGVAILQKAREENPYHLLATSKLADILEKKGQTEQALSLLAELVALPSTPGSRSKAVELWEKLGREPDALDAYLDEVYENLVYQFVQEKEPAAPALEDQQVVLGELFTGATCPPCVAADVATGALEKYFPESRFLMLRYHLHIPGPDPLTVADGEQRGAYYEIRGTPSVFFNGAPSPQAGGGFFASGGIYVSFKGALTPLMEQTSDLTIDLSAHADDGGIHLSATVNGTDEIPASWRLRLCLAEEVVHYPAPNGIRIHDMVVRKIPGGAEGIAATDGALSYEADIAIDEILADIQAGIKAANVRSGGVLPPLPAQVSRLRLVAFVQNDASREILQAASTPVDGLVTTTATPPASEPAAESEAEGSKPAAESESPTDPKPEAESKPETESDPPADSKESDVPPEPGDKN